MKEDAKYRCVSCKFFERKEGCGFGNCSKIQESDLLLIHSAEDWYVSLQFGCVAWKEMPYSKYEYNW